MPLRRADRWEPLIPLRPAREPAAEAILSRLLGAIAVLAILWVGVVVPLQERRRELPVDLVPVPRAPDPVIADVELEPEPEPNETLDLPDILRNNPLYEAGGLTPIDCPAPPLDRADAEAQREYHAQLFACLVDAWRLPLASAGLPLGSPQVFVFDDEGTGPCGSFRPASGRIVALYCPVNETIYVDAERLASLFPPEDHIAYGLILAHEFGHHAQQVAGILVAQRRVAYESPDRDTEMSRRTETQASCFAGMFFASVEESYPVQGRDRAAFEHYAFRSFGDNPREPDHARTHGSPQTQGTWIMRGFTLRDTGSCNTYRAPVLEVA